MNKTDFYLYHTLCCHLCEDAEAVIKPVADYLQLSFLKIDIADNDSLVELYGVRIPVLCNTSTGAELGWPFDAKMVLEFMGQH